MKSEDGSVLIISTNPWDSLSEMTDESSRPPLYPNIPRTKKPRHPGQGR